MVLQPRLGGGDLGGTDRKATELLGACAQLGAYAQLGAWLSSGGDGRCALERGNLPVELPERRQSPYREICALERGNLPVELLERRQSPYREICALERGNLPVELLERRQLRQME
jgi:hypothetical protein